MPALERGAWYGTISCSANSRPSSDRSDQSPKAFPPPLLRKLGSRPAWPGTASRPDVALLKLCATPDVLRGDSDQNPLRLAGSWGGLPPEQRDGAGIRVIWCVLFGEIQNVQGIAVRAPVFCADCLVGVQHHPVAIGDRHGAALAAYTSPSSGTIFRHRRTRQYVTLPG